jgi:hypothetical protein
MRRFVMKFTRDNTPLRTMALGFLAFCLSVGAAHAQPLQGKFSLPSEVHWGTATLQAGDYTFNLGGWRTSNTLQLTRNGKVVATLLSQAHSPSVANSAALVIESGKSGSTVREMRLPDIGVVLYYAPHTPGGAVKEREIAQTIPIAAIGPTR